MRHTITIILTLIALTVPAIAWDDHTYGDFLIQEGDDYDYLTLHGESEEGYGSVDMTGGKISDFYTHDTSTTTISAGNVGGMINYDEALVNIEGGSLASLNCKDSTVINFSGGEVIHILNLSGSSTFNIRGGKILERLCAADSSTVNIFAGNIQYDPNSLYVYTSWSGTEYYTGGKITGNWADGTYFEIQLRDRRSGQGDLITYNHVVLHELTPPEVIYVDDDANGANDGTSWTNAFNDLQDALKVATAFDKVKEIRVAQGTYKPDSGNGITPGDQDVSFSLIGSIALRGGFAGVLAEDPDARDDNLYRTVLTGDLNGDDLIPELPFNNMLDLEKLLRDANRTENSKCVVTGNTANEETVLDGFFITSGESGLYIDSVSPVVQNCVVCFNTYCGVKLHNSDAIFESCTIESNMGYYQAGMYIGRGNTKLNNCIFRLNWVRERGGAISCSTSSNRSFKDSLTLSECRFEQNYSGEYGGGVYSFHMNLIVTDCQFVNNSTDHDSGGAISIAGAPFDISGCVFDGNTSRGAGAIAVSTRNVGSINNCIFRDNSNGAINNLGWGDQIFIIENCDFINNHDRWAGGAIHNHGYLQVDRCRFIGNEAEKGAAFNIERGTAVISNSLFLENFSQEDSGLYCTMSSDTEVINCTFAPDDAQSGTGIIMNLTDPEYPCSLAVVNTILNNSEEPVWTNDMSMIRITHSLVRGGWQGIGNIDADPLFADADNGNYRLSPNSPCIDKGDNLVIEPDTLDLAGNQRIENDVVDMGAFEVQEPVQIALRVMPTTINRHAHHRRILAIVYLPPDISPDDIDTDTPLVMQPGNIPATFQRTTRSNKPVIFAMFDTSRLLTAIPDNGTAQLQITGILKQGQQFTGTDTIKIIDKSPKQKPQRKQKRQRKNKPRR